MLSPKMIFSMCKKSIPTILSVAAVGGVLATGYFTYKAASKHLDQVAERLFTNEDSGKETDEIRKEVLKENWKDYIPAAVAAAGTIACIIGANQIHLGKEAAMAGAVAFYKSLCDSKDRVFKESVVDKLDADGNVTRENGYSRSKEAAAQEVMYNPNDIRIKKIRIWEPYTKQWFEASQQEILWAEITANKMLHQKGSVCLNDVLRLYSDPNIKMTRKGKRLGWSWDDESFEEASCYYYSGGWIDMCPQFEEWNGSVRFVMDYGINPNDISSIV